VQTIAADIFYSTLSFEPADDSIWESEYTVSPIPPQAEESASRADPRVVTIHLPEDTEECLVTIEYPESLPSWDGADYAVAFT
jgi:hypothetical protein